MDLPETLKLWQRILREDALYEALQAPSPSAEDLNLSEEQLAVLKQLSQHAASVKWPRGYYRRQTRAFMLDAASQGLPLTLALLKDRGRDLGHLIFDFLNARDWPDYGPFQYRASREFLEDLMHRGDLDEIPGFRELSQLEHKTILMLMALANVPASQWAASEVPESFDPEVRYVRKPNAFVLTVDRVITPLLVEQASLPKALEAKPQHILGYLTHEDEMVGYAVLKREAKVTFDALEGPRSFTDLADRLEGTREHKTRQVQVALKQFLDLGIIRAVASDE